MLRKVHIAKLDILKIRNRVVYTDISHKLNIVCTVPLILHFKRCFKPELRYYNA